MTIDYVDVHSHIYFPDFDADREEEIRKIKESKIATITIGVDLETSKKAVDLAEKHDNLFASVGIHPHDADKVSSGISYDISKEMISLASHPKTVAIGECGLDYFRLADNPEKIKEIQKKVFENQINLALENRKPLMLHIRPSDKINFDAYKDSLDILESYAKTHGEKLSGAAHFFVGDVEVLKRFLTIGFSVTFGGVLTFARDYDQYVRYAPLSNILSETDSPFVAPVPYRGKRNSPLYIPEVVKAISEIRGEPHESVKKALLDNAVRMFKLV